VLAYGICTPSGIFRNHNTGSPDYNQIQSLPPREVAEGIADAMSMSPYKGLFGKNGAVPLAAVSAVKTAFSPL